MRRIASIAFSILALSGLAPDAGAQSQASSQADTQAGTSAGFQADTMADTQFGSHHSSQSGTLADTQAGLGPDSQAGTLVGVTGIDSPVRTGPLWGMTNLPVVITNGGGFGGFSMSQENNGQPKLGLMHGSRVPGAQSPALRGLQSPQMATNNRPSNNRAASQRSNAGRQVAASHARQRQFQLHGSVSTTARVSSNDMSLMKGPNGPVLTGALGEQTTLVPSDFFLFTGALGPADGGVTYTQDYLSQMRRHMSGRQFLGPMSVVRMNHGSLKPQVMSTQDVIVEGIPQRVSGTVIMETPDARAIERRIAARERRLYTAGRRARPLY